MWEKNLSAKSENLNFFLLTNPMCTILSLQVNLWVPIMKPLTVNRCNNSGTNTIIQKNTDQSLSYRMTTSAVARLMPRPPARVDNKKTNFSLPGLL